LIYACLQVLVKIREKPESRTTSGSFAKDAEKEMKDNFLAFLFYLIHWLDYTLIRGTATRQRGQLKLIKAFGVPLNGSPKALNIKEKVSSGGQHPSASAEQGGEFVI
jgi:hypothetical protein